MAFVFGASTAAASTKVLATATFYLEKEVTFSPCGREAMKLLGGQKKEAVSKEGGSGFDESLIIIPDGITPQNLKNYTLYDVLGFAGELGDSADTEVIKKAYHRAVLKYHPDKAQFKGSDGKEDRTVFLKIQEAFNVLSSEQKRRAYDSQLPFDDRIPTEEIVLKALAKGNHKFFKLYGPIFQRNARFATKKPVPDVGDMETPMPKVYKFYEYWVRFDSWRDFTGKGAEYKPDDAQSREEKRYMQKENEKLARKHKQKEMERLISLVNIAQKFDPRIVADKEAIKAAKESDKNNKESSAKNAAELEASARKWNDEIEAADAEKKGGSSKAEKEKFKKVVSKCRNTLKKLLRFSSTLGNGSGEYGIVTTEEAEILCANCTMDDLNAINDAMGGEAASKDQALVKADGFPVVMQMVEKAKNVAEWLKEDDVIGKDAKKRDAEDKVVLERSKGKKMPALGEREWSEDEINMLEICLNRYSTGRAERWVLIANYLNVKAKPPIGSPFKADDCLAQAFTMK
jgi:DnaJ family protein C protein 2